MSDPLPWMTSELVAALERLINDYRARSEAELDLLVEDDHRETLASLDPALRVAIYRVAQEAIANCHKHARATRIIVRLTLLEKRIVLQVLDNGRGFEERDLSVPGFSLGILGMRERLRPWSGVLRVERDVNGGTVLTAEIAVDGPMEETSNVE